MEKGKIVIEAGRDYKSMGVKKWEQLTVVGLDAHKKTVLLQKQDGSQVVWNPQREKKMNAYRSHEIDLAVTSDECNVMPLLMLKNILLPGNRFAAAVADKSGNDRLEMWLFK